jgi:hypothetical protein
MKVVLQVSCKPDRGALLWITDQWEGGLGCSMGAFGTECVSAGMGMVPGTPSLVG